ncbi:hypothetical protein [Undibacterium macrobrachii]|jgi:hypothetical protein|uniref:Uncharacterized protein n=1 Tax=Undibacterium macrobrachii TaxID=1119058 RepID=A0ABQ2XGJ4_9BURK|nr:hypothetical protein [Undibacterium macrobrachii]GGX15461.1 hypothetical protein GCM10011282_22260 [Undibacterium macrobrachii]
MYKKISRQILLLAAINLCLPNASSAAWANPQEANVGLPNILFGASGVPTSKMKYKGMYDMPVPSMPGLSDPELIYEARDDSVWVLYDGKKVEIGPRCMAAYVELDSGGMFYNWGIGKDAMSSIVYRGGSIPENKGEMKKVEVTMRVNGETGKFPFFHIGNALIIPVKMEATLKAAEDKSKVELLLDGKSVLTLNFEGTLKAKAALYKCMGVRET